MEIKIRYTWKQIKTGEIKQLVEYLENLECGQLLKEGVFMNPLWELIARDLWSGFIDVEKREIFADDVLKGDTTRFTANRYVGSSPKAKEFEGVVKYSGGGFKIVFSNQTIINRFGGSTSIYLNQADYLRILGNTRINPVNTDTNG